MYQILIADDHPLFRTALRGALAELKDPCTISECENFDQVQEHLRSGDIDLLLLDLKMPGNNGLMGLMRIRSEYPHLAVAVVSASEDASIISSIRNMGASGFIPKASSPLEIRQAVEKVFAGGVSFPEFSQVKSELTDKLRQLTPQQLRVLQFIAEGALNKQIAYSLNIKETTVKSHISDIFRKLNINNRTQAALIVQELSIPD
ncbi:response regulator [Thalassolituus sp. LLYu03]|uniref:response regulator n=1 Tax=Thalassolituus sp. LLYu03 TaxID=3421656 RepID=UPI003D2CC2F1